MNEHDAWSELLKFSSNIVDPRSRHGLRYSLPELLLVIISGLLAGAQNAEDIAYFAELHEEWLKKFSAYRNGMPKHDVILRILKLIAPDAVEEMVRAWVSSLLSSMGQTVAGGHVALDGKAIRGSAGRASGKSGVHMVGAYLTDAGVVLGNEVVNKKSNEITAIPQILRSLNLSGSTVTIDAMGCQRAIAEEIRAADAHYVLQVKDNQSGLRAECAELAAKVGEKRVSSGVEEALVERHRWVDKGHGRIETRLCYLIRDLSSVTRRELWKDMSGIVVMLRETEQVVSGKVSQEVSYYIVSDPAVSAKRVSSLIRDHWQIENGLHWSLDVVWGEDGHQLRDATAAANLSRLRRLALSMLKQSVGERMSGARLRQRCQADPATVLKVLAGEKIHSPRRRRANRRDVGRFGQGKGRRSATKRAAK